MYKKIEEEEDYEPISNAVSNYNPPTNESPSNNDQPAPPTNNITYNILIYNPPPRSYRSNYFQPTQ